MTDRIRDHSEPCKHKLESDWDAAFLRNGYWLCRICPGGREVTIDKVWVTSSGQTPNKVHAVFLIEDEATAYAKEHRQDVEEWTVGV